MKTIFKVLLIATLFAYSNIFAQEYTLSIQPTLSKEETIKSYQPLADYLSKETGHKIKIKAYRNFFTYWQKMKSEKNFDFVLDAAHFTDYRIVEKNYSVLAKIPNTISFSIVTRNDVFIFDTDELVLEKIATTPSPSLGGIRLYEIFQNPARLPIQVTVHDTSEAVKAIADGKVLAAIIPTPLVSNYDYLNTVMTTTPVPHMAFSASSKVPEEVKNDIKNALIQADNSEDGRIMLGKVKSEKFEKTSAKDYAGYSKLLKGLFGYVPSEEQVSQIGI
ncbi:hypothetical protein MNBD_GAMMA06-1384 [hydrothermal vent metagenome]|uniref:Uncharacterized protein n=1 Tax=hydrothermal vent metagenome TaxID=652676 RepID=A0A3B0WRC5_9ZZZZ